VEREGRKTFSRKKRIASRLHLKVNFVIHRQRQGIAMEVRRGRDYCLELLEGKSSEKLFYFVI